MKNALGCLARILRALLLGVCCTLVWLEYDPWFAQQVGVQVVQAIHQALWSDITFDAVYCSPLRCSIEFHNLRVRPCVAGHTWQWQARRFVVESSWWTLLRERILPLYMYADNPSGYSLVHTSGCALAAYIEAVMAEQCDIPFVVKSIVLRGADAQLRDVAGRYEGQVQADAQMMILPEAFLVRAQVHDGLIRGGGKRLLAQLRGQCELHWPLQNPHDVVSAYGQMSGTCPLLPPRFQPWHGTLSWKEGVGATDLTCCGGTVRCVPGIVSMASDGFAFQVTSAVQGEALAALVPYGADWVQQMKAHVVSSIHARADAYTMTSTLRAEHPQTPWLTEVRAHAQGSLYEGILDGTLHIETPAGIICTGRATHQTETLEGQAQLQAAPQVEEPRLPYALHLNRRSYWTGAWKGADALEGTYLLELSHELPERSHALEGTYAYHEGRMQVQGRYDQDAFAFSARVEPQCDEVQLTYTAQKGATFALQSDPSHAQALQGKVDYELVRPWLSSWLGLDCVGTGTILMTGQLDDDRIHLHAALADGNIRLGSTYNFLSSCSGDCVVDAMRRTVLLRNIQAGLHKGSVSCQQGLLRFTPDGQVDALHVPLSADHCFINKGKDAFAIVSGHAVLSKNLVSPYVLDGVIVVDRSQITKNLLSQDVQRSIMGGSSGGSEGLAMLPVSLPLQARLQVVSRDPVVVKTSFLQTQATLNLDVALASGEPQVTGAITLVEGKLNFPYKPLSLVRGSITFLPGQMHDPLIEIVARDRVKRFRVALDITGSAENPHLRFSSSPPLSEEQIVALLLAGMENESLSIAMPALLMHNLRGIVFNAEQKPSWVERHFSNLLESFKHIRVVPSFSDQAGRGGLRAAVEVEVNDRLRGILQKNFSLTEDTTWEIEYVLSDDVTARALKDERSDIGAELEVRWKF